jgi:hypothetical protein
MVRGIGLEVAALAFAMGPWHIVYLIPLFPRLTWHGITQKGVTVAVAIISKMSKQTALCESYPI